MKTQQKSTINYEEAKDQFENDGLDQMLLAKLRLLIDLEGLSVKKHVGALGKHGRGRKKHDIVSDIRRERAKLHHGLDQMLLAKLRLLIDLEGLSVKKHVGGRTKHGRGRKKHDIVSDIRRERETLHDGLDQLLIAKLRLLIELEGLPVKKHVGARVKHARGRKKHDIINDIRKEREKQQQQQPPLAAASMAGHQQPHPPQPFLALQVMKG